MYIHVILKVKIFDKNFYVLGRLKNKTELSLRRTLQQHQNMSEKNKQV